MTNGFSYQEIGSRIRELRGRVKQKEWAVRIGCDQGYISQVENGVTKPSLSFLKGVALLTDASIDWILTGRGPRTATEFAQTISAGSSEKYECVSSEQTISFLNDNPKIMTGVERLLKMDSLGRGILEAFGEMDEDRVAGLAGFLGVNRD